MSEHPNTTGDKLAADAAGSDVGTNATDTTDGTVVWRTFLDEARDRLSRAGFETADVDARRIVEQASGFEGTELFLGLEELVTQRAAVQFDRMLDRRLTGEPLQYVLGRWGFRNLDLFVDKRVLIPRPETEVVAEHAMSEIDRVVRVVGADSHARVPVADLGTGSGAIGLAIASERPSVDVWATELSSDAAAVARANLTGIGRPAARVRIEEGSWFEPLPADLVGRFAVIVSNPPYIGRSEDVPADVTDWEPTSALFSGDDGLDDITHILANAHRWLLPIGAVVLELSPHLAPAAASLAEQSGYREVDIHPDLTGRDRVLIARTPHQ